MNLFYAPPANIHGDRIKIEGQEAVHIARVLRYQAGDSIYVTDGQGRRYSCTIDHISKQDVRLSIDQSAFEEKEIPGVTIAIGVTKKRDRLEFAVEKVTELGADEIVLFNADHSEKTNLRKDRIFNTVLSAMKQSLRVYLPKISYYASTEELLYNIPESIQIILADEATDESSVDITNKKAGYYLIVGPEGGFSEKERRLFSSKKPVHYSLGTHRLRTETAAIIVTDHFKNRNRYK